MALLLREVIDFDVDYVLDWTYEVSIDDIRKDLDKLEQLGATHIEINSELEYDSAYTSIKAISRRLETDEELNKRQDFFNRQKEQQRKEDLAIIQRLKEKHGIE